MPLRSMTGFGRGEGSIDGSRLTVELRAVNHRYLDVRVRLPYELSDQISAAEAVAKGCLSRGRVEITGRLSAGGNAGPLLDVERARAAFTQLQQLRDDLAPDEAVPLSLLSSVPDLFGAATAFDGDAAARAVKEAVEAACADLDAMRVREGAALARDFDTRLTDLKGRVNLIDQRADSLVAERHERLRERVQKLLGPGGAPLDPTRLEQEVALLADRSDVMEELTRLRSHFDQFEQLTGAEEPQIGRKLDFLVQEMNREVNTIGSKSADADLTHTVVSMKAEIERIREQVQNVL
ncbi:MAG: YicC family protein [Deltaproteobacteria bacterium]|nr:MAG: YicC family protein [Deltaproteobacteria bacterium]